MKETSLDDYIKYDPPQDAPPSLEQLRQDWGGWTFDKERFTLTYAKTYGDDFEISLEGINSSSQMLNAIMQVADNRWAYDRVLAGFIRALSNLLDPQLNYCAAGVERGPVNSCNTIRKFLAARPS